MVPSEQPDGRVEVTNDAIAIQVSRQVSAGSPGAYHTRAQQEGQIERTNVAVTENRHPDADRDSPNDVTRLRRRAVYSYCTAPSHRVYHLTHFVPRAGVPKLSCGGKQLATTPGTPCFS